MHCAVPIKRQPLSCVLVIKFQLVILYFSMTFTSENYIKTITQFLAQQYQQIQFNIGGNTI